MASRKNVQSVNAELSLVHLKNCLVNLPSTLVSLLVNVNTPPQNVVVQLGFRPPASAATQPSSGSPEQSVFVGWTGMPSKRRAAAPVNRESGGRISSRDQPVQLVEMDAIFAHTLGLSDGQRVQATVHIDPHIAHTIHIEPMTPEDWEIIQLHATFLELNLQSQIRALPNPAYTGAADKPIPPHPLTLHLSPTSTANIKVVSLDPAPPASIPFSKLFPNAEVIVAPKTRARQSQNSGDHGSVASTSRSRRSGTSTLRRKSTREERKPAMFLRAIDRLYCGDWFDDVAPIHNLVVWVDGDLLFSTDFRGVNFVVANLIRPTGLQKPQPEGEASQAHQTPASSKVIARLLSWDDAPNGQAAALSTPLCVALGCKGIVGGIIKLQPAPQQLGRGMVKTVKVFPFAVSSKAADGLRFGSETKTEKEESAKRFKHIYAGSSPEKPGFLQGPVTDGVIVGLYDGLEAPQGWEGGIIKFGYGAEMEHGKEDATSWLAELDSKLQIEFQAPVPRPAWIVESDEFELQPTHDSALVGIDSLLANLESHLSHLSSVLLTGTMGSGKTSVAKYIAETLRKKKLFYTIYFSCRKLVTDETRISTIRETIERLFMSASWGARLGGKGVVVVDDLDKLCPVESELQVGNDNGRSRQISEAIRSIVRRYCTRNSNVVLLATAQSKDSLNNVVVSGHVVREIVELKAPNKEARRRVMETIARQNAIITSPDTGNLGSDSRPTTADGSNLGEGENGDWLHHEAENQDDRVSRSSSSSTGFILDADLDFVDIAGQTDGYMPGDLTVVISRARNEAIIRFLGSEYASSKSCSGDDPIRLSRVDFDKALKGFTPASLRNVSLQSSTTTFKSIGGLEGTRQVLLETLQYPTKYAPIFSQCPLRLRSGLLLYGFPGCGKTLLASAVAGECGLNFISVKGPEILNKYIGASEKSVRDLFDRAQAARPCVLFFDEFDSIAPKRGHDSTGVTDRVVNQLLTQMDGAEGLSGVYVLAATSRPDLIDPALLRPGRLDKSLLCDMPGAEDRLDILRALFVKVRLSDELAASEEAWEEIARRTEGFSGADLQALVSNSQLEAIHDVVDVGVGGARSAAAAVAVVVRGKSGGPNGTAKRGAAAAPSFIQFRYGADDDDDAVSSWPTTTVPQEQQSKSAALRLEQQAAVTRKLEQIKLARKRERQAHKEDGSMVAASGSGGDMSNLPTPAAAAAAANQKEVVIGWEHLVKALGNTRASISREEKDRLGRIYHDFVAGRSGKMRDGQGSTEIGGRSSLM